MIKHFKTKVSKIFDQGIKQSGKKINQARKKMMFGIICGIIESRSVRFDEIALCLNDEVQEESNLRRIQRFFAEYTMDYIQISIILMSFIPNRKLTLCIDRTNWQFGEQDYNILTLTVYYQGIGIPILFELLDKKGNSKQEERIDLLELFIKIFGVQRINCIMGDREFIGDKWYQYLKDNKINFYFRIPKSHLAEIDYEKIRVEELLTGKIWYFKNGVKFNGIEVNMAAHYMSNPRDKDDKYLIVITNKSPDNACEIYRKRWSIETFFQAIKGRGFKVEETHLENMERLKKLIALVSLAFIWSLTIGIWQHENVKEIAIKNHGYKAKSFFRVGVDKIRRIFKRINEKLNQFELIINILLENIKKINLCYHLDIKNVM